MEEIGITYIDDNMDLELQKYFDKEYHNQDYNIIFKCKKFDPNIGYEELINDEKVRNANIIIIDSKLFENNNVNSGKFTGEEFKLILKKVFPFIEVIIITQNEIDGEIEKVPKFNSKEQNCSKKHYDEHLLPLIDKSIKKIIETRKIFEIMEKNENLEKPLVEKIINSLNWLDEYDELSKTDIDELIKSFRQLEEKVNGWLSKNKILSFIWKYKFK